MTGLGFPRRSRITRKTEFVNVLETGKKTASADFVLWRKPCGPGLNTPRLGVMVSKKLGGAVIRNRAKRLIREVFRLNRRHLIEGVDMILYPRTVENLHDFDSAQKAIFTVWRKAGVVENAD